MKNLLGIFCPPYTCAELGKNGPRGPSPSPSIAAGESGGFAITALVCQRAVRKYQQSDPMLASRANPIARRAAVGTAPAPNQPRLPAQTASRIPTAAVHRTIWR